MAICVFPFSYCLSLGISSQTVLHLLGIFSVFVIFSPMYCCCINYCIVSVLLCHAVLYSSWTRQLRISDFARMSHFQFLTIHSFVSPLAGQLCKNTISCTKPAVPVYNILQNGAKQQPQLTCTENFCEVWTSDFWDMQVDRHSDMLIAIAPLLKGEVLVKFVACLLASGWKPTVRPSMFAPHHAALQSNWAAMVRPCWRHLRLTTSGDVRMRPCYPRCCNSLRIRHSECYRIFSTMCHWS